MLDQQKGIETKEVEAATSVVIDFDQARRTIQLEPPLSSSEIRQLRKLAGLADQLIHLLGQAEHGKSQCPTWRRIQEEYAEMKGLSAHP